MREACLDWGHVFVRPVGEFAVIDHISKIGNARPAQPVKRVGSTKPGDTAGFAKHMGEVGAAEETAATLAASGLNAVGAVLGAQEVDDALARAARGKARAEDLLGMLDDLRLELLAGNVSIGRLQTLARIVANRRPDISDPKLAAILDDIDLRAQVELAKYQMAVTA